MFPVKFRGRTFSGQWVYGYYVKIDERNSYIYPSYQSDSDTPTIPTLVCTETVGLFIGRKDKVGHELYDQDLVRTKNQKVLKIIWNSMGAGGWWFVEMKNMELYHVSEVNLDELELVGNYYDNPELLEAG
jgi:hypothetical protein